jgi:hypothetical protein
MDYSSDAQGWGNPNDKAIVIKILSLNMAQFVQITPGGDVLHFTN